MLEKGKRIPIPFPPLEFQQGDVIPEGMRSVTSPPRVKSELQLSSPTIFKVKMEPDYELSDSGDDDGNGDRDGDGGDIPRVRSLRCRGRSMIIEEKPAVNMDDDEDGGVSQDGGDELEG